MTRTDLPRTLFVGEAKSAVTWYRCALPAMVLGCDWLGATPPGRRLQGTTGVVGGGGTSAVPEDYEVVVVQLARGRDWLHAIRAWQEAGVTVLYEVDDWLRGVRRNRDHDFRHVVDRKRVEDAERCMAVCDGVICSTEWLARRYRRVNPNTVVCRNGIDLKRYALTRPQRDDVAIGWAGATGHRSSVRAWLDAVATVMREQPATRFISVGQPFADALSGEFGQRTLSVPFALLDTYPATMSLFDVALAPAGEGSFYKGKSDLRWLEASALGIPTIGDPGVYPEIEHGVTGFHARTPAEALTHLRALVEDEGLRERVGAAAKAHVTEHRRIERAAEAWADVLCEARAASVRHRAVARTTVAEDDAPRVSVIVTAYDYGDYVGAAIESVLRQDHVDGGIEVVVVDDGSTDHTPEVVAGFGDRVRSIRQENAGLLAATHTGIEAARGELLTFLDADDEWPRDRVRLLVDALDAHPRAGLAYGDMELVNDTGWLLARSFRAASKLPVLDGDVYGQLLRSNAVSAGSMMVRASLRDRFHPQSPDAPLQQDWWIACRVAEVAEIVSIPQVVNRYRVHGANMNIGSDLAQQRRLTAGELRFRRWLLTTVRDGQATPEQLQDAVRNFDAGRALVGPADGAPVLEPDAAAHGAAMAAAAAALDAGDLGRAAVALANAAAADPTDPGSRELLAAIGGVELVT